jgi:hypothetical protein
MDDWQFVMRLWRFIRSLFEELLDQPRDELVLRLTLLILILHGSSTALLDIALKVLCGYMLVSRVHLKHFGLWVVICGFVWWINARHWLWIDNHKYLISYWVLVCALGVGVKDTERILAWNGRLLLGLCFAFATGWKLLAGQYLNGEFMYYTLLIDDRMELFARVGGGVSSADLSQARMLEDHLGIFPSETIQASLPESARLLGVALAMAWWTVAIEGAIALSFLATWPRWLSRWRDWMLLGFVGATYVFVPVMGFGYVLAILGLASCPRERGRARAAYLAVLIVIQLGQIPFEKLPWLEKMAGA